MLHNNFSTPSLLLPGLAFPLFFFVAFAGTVARQRRARLPVSRRLHGVPVRLRAAPVGGVRRSLHRLRDRPGLRDRLCAAADAGGAGPSRILLGYALGALGRWSVTATVPTIVALLAGMQVGGNGVDIFALYALAVLVNACGLLWSAGIAMRLRTMQAAPLMQLPIFLSLFFAPVFVPIALLADWLRVIAHLNPVTLLLGAGRSLIAGAPSTLPTRSASR